jgi:hypothetical protein
MTKENFTEWAWFVMAEVSEKYHINIETINAMQDRVCDILGELHSKEYSEKDAAKEVYYRVFAN